MPTLQGYTQTFPGGTLDVYTTPFPIAVGTQARDSFGNVFVFCDNAAQTFYSGQWVTINQENNRATVLTTSGRGPVGVVMQGSPTAVTDAGSRGHWVQVYGRVLAQIGGSVVSPSDAANGPTTDADTLQNTFLLPTSATTPAGVAYYTSNVAGVSSGQQNVIIGVTVAIGAAPADVSGHAGQGGVQSRESTPAVTAVTSAASFVGSSIYVFLNWPHIMQRPADSGAAT